MPKRSAGGRARRAAQRCWAEAGTTRGSSPGGPRRCRGARQEGPARGRSAMLSDAPGTCAARAAGARERALLFYCCLFGNMLGAEKKGKEKLGGSCPRSQGKGQTDCHTAPGAGHFPPLRAPTILSLQDADGLHWPPAPKGQPARDREPAFQAWGPHGEPCVLRPPSSRLGPAARASACPSRPQLLPGRGGVRGGGSSRPQDSCPPRRNPSHRQTPCRLRREGGDTEGTHACL